MNVTLTSLEALILKATNEALPCPDPAALEAFCAVMRQSPDGPQMAAQTLAARIHVPHSQKALLALAMTDRCMRKCGADFHAEVGKFRFLNEMIKLVSPKYLADRTAPEVKTRVLQILHAWSIEYPQEFKFKVAYDMLKNQGVVKETPPPLPPEESAPLKPRTKNPITEDAEKTKLLQKLLQSKKPEDIQHANRLIKTMVREEERRSEVDIRREQELTTALDSASLLSDMLEFGHSASPEEVQLIHDLHSIMRKMRIVLDEIASQTDDMECLDEVIKAINILNGIHHKYNAFVMKQDKKKSENNPVTDHNSLLDFAGANVEGASKKSEPKNVAKNAIDELGDIFSAEGASGTAAPLQPVNLMQDDVDLLGEKTKTEGWNELDSLGEQLLKQSLPENAKRVDGFNGKSTKPKIPMNALTSPKREAPSSDPVYDLDFFTKKPEDEKQTISATPISPGASNDDVMVDISETPSNPTSNILELSTPRETFNINSPRETPCINSPSTEHLNGKLKSKVEVFPPTGIYLNRESVVPSEVPPLTAYEDKEGLTVVFHFCKDRPRPEVNVIVITTTSRSSSYIEDFKIQCFDNKGCKVRQLPASGTTFDPLNPFIPPATVTQIMLIARPPACPPIDLKFVITYTIDGTTFSEIGEVKNLPFDEIESQHESQHEYFFRDLE